MVALNFQRRFVAAIVAGRKTQTIRPVSRVVIKRGLALQLYTGMRTSKCRKLGPDRLCLAVWPFAMEVTPSGISAMAIGGARLSPDAYDAFARDDGFADARDMWAFFLDLYGCGRFEGRLIQWGSPDVSRGAPTPRNPAEASVAA